MKKHWGWLLLTFLTTLIYFILPRPKGVIHYLAVPLDARLPIWPIFVWPYLVFLIVFWLVILYAFWTDRRFVPLAKTITLTFLVAYVVYIIYPTGVVRSTISGTDWSSQLLGWLYRHDWPEKAFPSLHNASAAVVIFYALIERLRGRIWIVAFCIIVIMSTVILKQHYLLDLVSGLALGSLISWYFLVWSARLVGGNKNS